MWSFAHFFSIKSIEKVQRQYILCFTLSTQELPATCFRQVGMAIQKTGKVVMLQKHPFGTPHSRFTGNRWWYHDWVSNWHTWKAQSRARTEWGLRNTLRNIWLNKGYHYMAQEHFICIVPNKTYPKNCTETWEHTRLHLWFTHRVSRERVESHNKHKMKEQRSSVKRKSGNYIKINTLREHTSNILRNQFARASRQTDALS